MHVHHLTTASQTVDTDARRRAGLDEPVEEPGILRDTPRREGDGGELPRPGPQHPIDHEVQPRDLRAELCDDGGPDGAAQVGI